ncbi:hypothetical protein FHX05_005786 [Rhizobium sp. BK491]|nr:hypothetical protein [Rhizobium sp. BK491]
MGLPGGVATPAIESVVERQARLQLLEVVAEHPGQPERRCKQPCHFRGKLRSSRIRASDDRREAQKRGRSGTTAPAYVEIRTHRQNGVKYTGLLVEGGATPLEDRMKG